MDETKLVKAFRRLSQGSKQSVQSGLELDDFDDYMHIDRPIDKAVRRAMDDIRQKGGGILLLVGSAGDGKSHILSTPSHCIISSTVLICASFLQEPNNKQPNNKANLLIESFP